MDNDKLNDSIEDNCFPNLHNSALWNLKEKLHVSHLSWKAGVPHHNQMTIIEQHKPDEISVSYDQLKNIPTEVLNKNTVLFTHKTIDENSEMSCCNLSEDNSNDNADNLEKDDSEEESEDELDEEDDDDSYESEDENTDSLWSSSKTSNNMFSYGSHEQQQKNSTKADNNADKFDVEKKNGRKNSHGVDCTSKKEQSSNWLTNQMYSRTSSRKLLTRILPFGRQTLISPHCSDSLIWKIIASACSEPPRRRKLSSVNTFNDVIKLIEKSKNIIVLTGAGVSVSCGIPDFRSNDGIYSRLAKDFPDLPDPQAMFDINYFTRDPRPFYRFAREIYPGQFKPSPCHRFIKLLEDKNKLLRNYTQNIDTLEQVAGIKNVIECHGSFSTATCTKCKYKCSSESIRTAIFEQRIPVCPQCQPHVDQSVNTSQVLSEDGLHNLVKNGIMKPDIVFFGEGLSDEFHNVMASDKYECDLLIVIGSSLKVRPVALIPSCIPAHVPQILINREKLHHLDFDVKLLGDGDIIINQICHHLGGDFKNICFNDEMLQETTDLVPNLVMETKTDKMEIIGNVKTDCVKYRHLPKPNAYIWNQTPTSHRRYVLLNTSKKDDDSQDDKAKPSTEEAKPLKGEYCPASCCCNSQLQQPWQQNKKISDRLLSGTYYWHEASASYVFPGAQVSSCSDTETDDDEFFNEIAPLSVAEESVNAYCSRHQRKVDVSPLSPIMTPSIEAEMINDIESGKIMSHSSANTNNYQFSLQSSNFTKAFNRHTKNDTIIGTETNNYSKTTNTRYPVSMNTINEFNHAPPHKRPRESLQTNDIPEVADSKIKSLHDATQLSSSNDVPVSSL